MDKDKSEPKDLKELHEIAEEWLTQNGYGGLCNTDLECGCRIGDIMPCGEPRHDCCGGYLSKSVGDNDWIVSLNPQKPRAGGSNDR